MHWLGLFRGNFRTSLVALVEIQRDGFVRVVLVGRVPGTVVAAQLEIEGVCPDFARC